MLISHSLKCPYLHYKHWSQTLGKNVRGSEKRIRSRVIRPPEMLSSQTPRLPKTATISAGEKKKKDAALHPNFTSLFSVTFTCWLRLWSDCSPEEYVSVVLHTLAVLPTERPCIFRKSLFCWRVTARRRLNLDTQRELARKNNKKITYLLFYKVFNSVWTTSSGYNGEMAKVGLGGMCSKTKWIQIAAFTVKALGDLQVDFETA